MVARITVTPNQAFHLTAAADVKSGFRVLPAAAAGELVRLAQMAMHLQDEKPLEIVFGIRDGDHIRFEVLGLTCPQAEEDWYRAQLNAEIHINVGRFRGYRSLVMFSDDFQLFRAALNRLLSGEKVGAALETSDFLSVDVSADGSSYNVWMQLDALERDGEEVLRDGGAENWEWRLAMDRASLDRLLAAVIRVSERCPTWSVPRS